MAGWLKKQSLLCKGCLSVQDWARICTEQDYGTVLKSQQACCPGSDHDPSYVIWHIRWQGPDKGDGSPAEH